MQLTIKSLSYKSTKVKLKVEHTFRVIELCQFLISITHNDYFFLTVISSLLANFIKLSKYTLFSIICQTIYIIFTNIHIITTEYSKTAPIYPKYCKKTRYIEVSTAFFIFTKRSRESNQHFSNSTVAIATTHPHEQPTTTSKHHFLKTQCIIFY